MTRFAPDGTPRPLSREERARQWTHAVMPLLTVGFLMVAGWVFLRAWFTWTPIMPAGDSPTSSAVVSSPSSESIALSVNLLTAAQAVSTAFAPTPEPMPTPLPSPTYSALPTPVPYFCGMNAIDGEPCQWPVSTATPEPAPPVCVTPVEREHCVWREPANEAS